MPRSTAETLRPSAVRLAHPRGRARRGRAPSPPGLALRLLLLLLTLVPAASAAVALEGDWPATEAPVSLELSQAPRAAAIHQLADAAGWSVVLEAPPQDAIDLRVKRESPAKVLEAVLREGDWVAHRDGNLVSIAPRPAPAAAAPQASSASAPAPAAPRASSASAPGASAGPASPPVPASKAAKDRVVAGNSVVLGPTETAKDLAVFGGSAEIRGTVTGDLVVFGGTATVRPGARVLGDCVVFGGFVDVDPGGEIDGDQVAFGGSIRKNGEVVSSGFPLEPGWKPRHRPWTGPGIAARVAHSVASTAMLFLFGAFLLAVLRERMEALEVAFVARPLASLGRGLLASLLLLVSTVVLVVTCIGIPVAATLLLLALFAGGMGLCAILATVGAALVRHRSRSPYAHLAVGCALFLLLGLVPFAGPLGTTVLQVMGLGVVVLTRGAGLWPAAAR